MIALTLVRRDGSRHVVRFDPEDAATVAAHRWRIQPTRTPGRLYVITSIVRDGRRTTLSMHRLLTGFAGGVDHVNGDGLDNRRANLRMASAVENSANRRTTAHSSRFKGVTKHRDGKWQAAIAKCYLGLYDTEEQAAAAYDVEATRRWGIYANLNLAAVS